MGELQLSLLLILNRATQSGGAEVQLLHLARGLAAKGHRVVLCSIARSELEPGELAGTGVELVELGVENRGGRPLSVPRLASLARDADVVHCTMWDASLWGRLAAIGARRPVIVADHATDRSVQVADSGAPRAAWIARHNRLLDRFTYATVICATSQRRLLLEEGVDAEKIVHIPNGVPTEAIARAAARGPTRQSLGLAEGDPVAIQIGSFREEKNQLGALEAVREARATVPRAQIVFVGEGPTTEAVEARAAAIGAGDWAHFLGYRPDAPALLGAADVLLLPSTSDAMPMTAIESMAAGVPVMATDVGDVRAMLGESGLCVPAGDPGALAGELTRLLSDPALRARLGEAGRARARAYDSTAMVRRYEALFAAAQAGAPPIPAPRTGSLRALPRL